MWSDILEVIGQGFIELYYSRVLSEMEARCYAAAFPNTCVWCAQKRSSPNESLRPGSSTARPALIRLRWAGTAWSSA